MRRLPMRKIMQALRLRAAGLSTREIAASLSIGHPDDGYGCSRFCELYRRWEGRLSPSMRQHHVAGERVFVDYAGDTLNIVDGATGEASSPVAQRSFDPVDRTKGAEGPEGRPAQIFVGVLGASNYTYAEV